MSLIIFQNIINSKLFYILIIIDQVVENNILWKVVLECLNKAQSLRITG